MIVIGKCLGLIWRWGARHVFVESKINKNHPRDSTMMMKTSACLGSATNVHGKTVAIVEGLVFYMVNKGTYTHTIFFVTRVKNV